MPMLFARSGSTAVRRCGRCADCRLIPLPLFESAVARELPDEHAAPLPVMPLPEQVVAHYQTIRLSLKGHPMEFLRATFAQQYENE